MRKIFFAVLLCTIVNTNISAQIIEPIKWETSVERISDTEYHLVIKAKIEKGWHLYAQKLPENGPIPTIFNFQKNDKAFKLIGEITEEEGHEEFDKTFEMNIKSFENQTIFMQRIKLFNDKQLNRISASVRFMACNNTSCLPPTEKELVFKFPLKISY